MLSDSDFISDSYSVIMRFYGSFISSMRFVKVFTLYNFIFICMETQNYNLFSSVIILCK